MVEAVRQAEDQAYQLAADDHALLSVKRSALGCFVRAAVLLEAFQGSHQLKLRQHEHGLAVRFWVER